MQLSQIYSNRPSIFTPIAFNSGASAKILNVVFARVKKKKQREGDSHNLGKTTLIHLIDFLLLKDVSGGASFLTKHSERFSEFVFFIEIALHEGGYVSRASRSRRSERAHYEALLLSARRTAFGSRLITSISVRAAPDGRRVPNSHLRTVPTPVPMTAANSRCDRPSLWRASRASVSLGVTRCTMTSAFSPRAYFSASSQLAMMSSASRLLFAFFTFFAIAVEYPNGAQASIDARGRHVQGFSDI